MLNTPLCRHLALTAALLSFIINALTSILLHYLPNDPFRLAANLSLYCFFATLISIAGFVGAYKVSHLLHCQPKPLSGVLTDDLNVATRPSLNFPLTCDILQRHPTLVQIFSNHLLVDAVLTTLPRLVLIYLSTSLPPTICHPSPAWLAFYPSNDEISPSSPEEWERMARWSTRAEHTCQVVVWTLQVIVGVLVVCETMMQWWVALRVREYARELSRREDEKIKRDEPILTELGEGKA